MTWHPINLDYPPAINTLIQHGDEQGRFKKLSLMAGVPCAVLATIPETADDEPIIYAIPIAECLACYGAFADLATAASLSDYLDGRYLTASRPDWWPLERELIAARSLWELQKIRHRWPESLRAEVRTQWAIDGRLAAIDRRIEILKLKYGEVAA